MTLPLKLTRSARPLLFLPALFLLLLLGNTGAQAQVLTVGTVSAANSTGNTITPQEAGITGGTAPYSTVFSYCATTNGTYSQIGAAVVGASPVASAAATMLGPATTYYFRAVTTDSAGTPAVVTAPSTTTGTPLTTLPGLSNVLLAQTSATNSTATVTATPVGGGTGPYTYAFYLCSQSDLQTYASFVPGTAVQTGSANTFVVTGLTPGMAQYVTCTVVDTAANGLTYLAISEKAQAAVALPAALKIGLYGDSQTDGMRILDSGLGVASTLQSLPGITTATVTVQGTNGATTASMLPGTSSYIAALAAFQAAGVQWVYLMEQANDSYNNVTPATHKANILAIATAFNAQGIRLIVGDAPYSTLYDTVKIYNFHAAEDAAADGVNILRGSRSVYWYFGVHRDALIDGVHPTTAGYGLLEKLIGASIYKAITESASPNANLSLTITGTGSTRNLSWTADWLATSYKVYRGSTADTMAAIATVAAGTLTYTDTARPAGNVYYSIISLH